MSGFPFWGFNVHLWLRRAALVDALDARLELVQACSVLEHCCSVSGRSLEPDARSMSLIDVCVSAAELCENPRCRHKTKGKGASRRPKQSDAGNKKGDNWHLCGGCYSRYDRGRGTL